MIASNRFPKLFEPGFIGSLEVPNRIMMAPMATNFPTETGAVTSQLVDYYEARAKGGTGLIIVENISVSWPEAHNGITQLRIDDERYMPGLHRLVEAIHNWGAKAVVQLNHAGGAAKSKEGSQPLAPSAMKYPNAEQPARELTVPEILRIVDDFAEATARAKRIGFDGVEVHGAHAYLPAQFMSPWTNKREDEYGGTPEGRTKFSLQIVEAIRKKVGPDYPLLFRINCEEYRGSRGLTLDDAKIQARLLAEAGVHALDVTAFGNAPVSCPMSYPPAWKAPLSQAIKETVDVPVILAGAIKDPETAEELLVKGITDYIAIGRGLIADPEWANKAMQGRSADILRCVSCNVACGGHRAVGWFLSCSLNPAAGREKEFEIRPAPVAKRVMVVGGGPGGMEAARVAKLRGHDVTLYERKPSLGGQLMLSSLPPGKDKWKWFEDYQIAQLKALGVGIELNTEVTPSAVEEMRPDAVIVATGADATRPNIKGIDRGIVALATDVLENDAVPGTGRVAVLGGGLVGLETASFVAAKGREVVILRRAKTVEVDRGSDVLDRLRQSNVEIRLGVEVAEILDDAILISAGDGKTERIGCDCVIVARGMTPNRALAGSLRGHVNELYTVGDARETRRIRDAVYEGAWAARQI